MNYGTAVEQTWKYNGRALNFFNALIMLLLISYLGKNRDRRLALGTMEELMGTIYVRRLICWMLLFLDPFFLSLCVCVCVCVSVCVAFLGQAAGREREGAEEA